MSEDLIDQAVAVLVWSGVGLATITWAWLGGVAVAAALTHARQVLRPTPPTGIQRGPR